VTASDVGAILPDDLPTGTAHPDDSFLEDS